MFDKTKAIKKEKVCFFNPKIYVKKFFLCFFFLEGESFFKNQRKAALAEKVVVTGSTGIRLPTESTAGCTMATFLAIGLQNLLLFVLFLPFHPAKSLLN